MRVIHAKAKPIEVDNDDAFARIRILTEKEGLQSFVTKLEQWFEGYHMFNEQHKPWKKPDLGFLDEMAEVYPVKPHKVLWRTTSTAEDVDHYETKTFELGHQPYQSWATTRESCLNYWKNVGRFIDIGGRIPILVSANIPNKEQLVDSNTVAALIRDVFAYLEWVRLNQTFTLKEQKLLDWFKRTKHRLSDEFLVDDGYMGQGEVICKLGKPIKVKTVETLHR